MEEKFDIGHFLKKAFVIAIGASLIFIGFIALLTLVGVLIAIPLLSKGSKLLFEKNDEEKMSRKLKWKTPHCEAKIKFNESDLLDEKS
ncbi:MULTISPECIES: hypothetical protein [Listeria]|uniref:hypothetical protein n=1 Tax=Listeria TaxID=1637 RepID=UPI000B5883BF|nr:MULTISPECIES: hypothetical protein [Listeria]